MTSIFSLRRSLLILVVAAGLGLGLTPAMSATLATSATSASGARRPAPVAPRIVCPSAGPSHSALTHLWQVLHGMWEALGSSMDPLGNH